jgi:molybdopterin synthase catalytic subunit
MKAFEITSTAIDVGALRARLSSPAAGAVVCFEGTVRNEHEGRAVSALGYQAYTELAEREGAAIVAQACERHPITHALAAHRIGALEIGETSVWVGVSAPHRAAAFDACRFLIDEIKSRVPIWKQERYADGASEWLHPE